MNQLESAALTLAGVMLAFLAIGAGIWWMRRPRTVPAAPRAPRAPGESRMPKLPRRAKPELDPVAMAPSRLARISRKTPIDHLSDEGEVAADPAPIAVSDSETQDARLESMISDVVQEAQHAEEQSPDEPVAEEESAEDVTLRLVPQIPPRDAISTSSWLGGRPRLPSGMEWPQIGGEPADFLAQIDCASLPRDLWGGIGPRDGALAFFIHRRDYSVRILHLRDADAPVVPPLPLDRWFKPYGEPGLGEPAFSVVRAFPEWPVDLVAVRPGDAEPRGEGQPDEPGVALYNRGYDIADPAFHPFDWDSMTAMVASLEIRLDPLVTAGDPPAGASGEDIAEAQQRAAINREARARAEEIIAIVRDSAGRQAFAAGDATAVMAALHAIRWTKANLAIDPETGAERIETITLPLTTHRPDADLWVHDYLTILFDRAKHGWCANPDRLSAPARAFFEPWWSELGAREVAAMGHVPFRHLHDYDAERDAVLIELPTSGLMSRMFGDGDNLVVTIDKGDLATGDFSNPRVQVSH